MADKSIFDGKGRHYQDPEYDDETFSHVDQDNQHGHDEHGKNCHIHDDHWQDDFAYIDEKRTPVPDGAPRLSDVAKIIKRMASDSDNPVIYRFALIYADGETGNMQVMTNPGMSNGAAINLLTRAASIMGYQDAQNEKEAEHVMTHSLQRALRGAVEDGDELPDLSAIFGGNPHLFRGPTGVRNRDEKADDKTDMRDGYL